MSWIFDNIPWWAWAMLLSGGGAAALALIPGALAFVVGIYNAMPVWLRYATGAIILAWLAHIAGRNIGAANARARQEALDEQARNTAREINRDVEKLDDRQVTKELEEHGGLWDDPPPRRTFGKRKR